MPDQLEVGVANPVADGGLGAGEEVVQYSDFVAEKHQTVNKMRADEPGAASDKDALALGGRDKLDGREAGESGVRDRSSFGVVDGLGLVACESLRETRVRLGLLVGIRGAQTIGDSFGQDVVGPEVKRAEDIERDFAVEAKALEADACDLLAALVDGADLLRGHRWRGRSEGGETCAPSPQSPFESNQPRL